MKGRSVPQEPVVRGRYRPEADITIAKSRFHAFVILPQKMDGQMPN